MKKFIPGLILLTLASALAADMALEAVVLNQELDFLKESARNTTIPTEKPTVQTVETRISAPTRPLDTTSLEATFFGNVEEDTVSTRTAPRRRRDVEVE